MIEPIVRYLHAARVPFRLASYPSAEAEPKAAHRVPNGGMLIDTKILLLGGKPLLACFPAGETPDISAVGAALGGMVLEGTTRELPDEFHGAALPVPPLGLFGLPLVLDDRVASASMLVFRAFGESDYFEIPYEDFARLERPRMAAFASLGELTAAGGTGDGQPSAER